MAQPLREPRDFDAYYKAFFKDIKDNMPYNTTAIPPRGEATGTTQLPRKSTIHWYSNFSNNVSVKN